MSFKTYELVSWLSVGKVLAAKFDDLSSTGIYVGRESASIELFLDLYRHT